MLQTSTETLNVDMAVTRQTVQIMSSESLFNNLDTEIKSATAIIMTPLWI